MGNPVGERDVGQIDRGEREMAETMRALVFLGIDRVGIVEKPIPEPGPRDAVIRTTASITEVSPANSQVREKCFGSSHAVISPPALPSTW